MNKKSENLPFYEIEHTADKGIHVQGSSLEDLFINMVHGMYHIIYDDINKIKNKKLKNKRSIILEESALSDLLINWLSEINFIHQVENIFITEINKLCISKKENHYVLTADLSGIDCLPYKVFVKTEIKAVTYHQVRITKIHNGYEGQVIFDV